MYNTYTTSDLIDDILLLGHVPLGNNTFDEPKVLRIATLELQTPLMKQILSTRGGYYLGYEDYAAASDGLYTIPSGAIAGSLANVEIVSDTNIIQVGLLEESEQASTDSPSSSKYGFYMRGNFVQILPTQFSGIVRLWYAKRTSRLIVTTSACQITDVNGAVITVSSIPSTITIGKSLDACGDQPPFNILGTRTITDITGTDITLATAVTGLAEGDWLALQGQTPIPQIPVEYRLLLAQRVVCKVYELQNAQEKLKAAKIVLKEYEDAVMNLITPRVKSQTKIISSSSGGFLGGGGRMSRFTAAPGV